MRWYPFPEGQSSTGLLAFLLSLAAVILWFTAGSMSGGYDLFAWLGCAGATILAFALGAYAHVEKAGRVEAAWSALLTSTVMIVYYAYVRVF